MCSTIHLNETNGGDGVKRKVLGFLNTYKFSVISGVLLVFATLLLSAFKDVIVAGGDILSFSVRDVFLICWWPLLSALHGILSCLFLKKTWMPSVVLCVTTWLTFIVLNLNDIPRMTAVFSLSALVWPCVAFVFSCFFSLVAKLIWWIIKEMKANW